MHQEGVPYNILRPPYASGMCALQQPQASLCIRKVCLKTASGLPMHQEGVPYNLLRPPYASWRCALQQPQASLCIMK